MLPRVPQTPASAMPVGNQASHDGDRARPSLPRLPELFHQSLCTHMGGSWELRDRPEYPLSPLRVRSSHPGRLLTARAAFSSRVCLRAVALAPGARESPRNFGCRYQGCLVARLATQTCHPAPLYDGQQSPLPPSFFLARYGYCCSTALEIPGRERIDGPLAFTATRLKVNTLPILQTCYSRTRRARLIAMCHHRIDC